MATGMRTVVVVVHRYIGLLLAGFLVIAGVSGSLLAWNDELETFVSPQLFRVAAPNGAVALAPLELHARVRALYPGAIVTRLPLVYEPERSVLFTLRGLPGGARRKASEPPNDQVFVDPYSGQVLGERKWGDLSQGRKNLMPFIYQLHYSLALGGIGTIVFGIVALLWTIDCFAGAWLTLPARLRLNRWWPAWRVRTGSAYKLNFDLHRAGGLWTWAMLFVLAWSSVFFNLPQVYEPVMRAVFPHQPGLAQLPKAAVPTLQPGLPWEQALPLARGLMASQARERGFAVLAEKVLVYEPQRAIYRYDVRSSHDIRDRGGNTRMVFDANTGAFKGLWLPTGGAAGDTLTTWMVALHMATVGGLAMQWLLCALGLVVSVLCISGVVIWLKKRNGRRVARRLRIGQAQAV